MNHGLKEVYKIEEKLGYSFQDKQLLTLAFTHRSFANENRESTKEHNERLEFLGDSILGFMVSEFLYTKFPHSTEGTLSAWKARLVDASSCCQYVQQLGVQDYLLMGKGEMMNAGKGRDSIVADLFEALLGALYMDSGIQTAKQFFFRHFETVLMQLIEEPLCNWKAMLQDFFQKKYQKRPTYAVINEEGPDHEKTFYVGVYIDQDLLGSGSGLSKKEAEQQAARNAYEKLLSGR